MYLLDTNVWLELLLAVRRICLSALDLRRVLSAMKRFHLDFDDAYQYVAAERNGLVLVSFDADFDKTYMGRKTPADILDGGL